MAGGERTLIASHIAPHTALMCNQTTGLCEKLFAAGARPKFTFSFFRQRMEFSRWLSSFSLSIHYSDAKHSFQSAKNNISFQYEAFFVAASSYEFIYCFNDCLF